MTEKRKPTYDIEAVKAVFSTVEKLNVTGSALKGAASLGFGRNEIVARLCQSKCTVLAEWER